jgi:hypothetical protein
MFSENEKANAVDGSGAGVGRASGLSEVAKATGFYTVECFDADGNVKWSDRIDNVVTTVGKNDALDKYLSGSAYTAAWYLGLISLTGYVSVPVVGDTAASHATWTEDQGYSQGTRPAAAFAAAAAGSKALSSAAVFTMNANTTIKGCFLISISTKGGATGILYSAGLFSGGDKVMQSGDTLNVSYTASL